MLAFATIVVLLLVVMPALIYALGRLAAGRAHHRMTLADRLQLHREQQKRR